MIIILICFMQNINNRKTSYFYKLLFVYKQEQWEFSIKWMDGIAYQIHKHNINMKLAYKRSHFHTALLFTELTGWLAEIAD